MNTTLVTGMDFLRVISSAIADAGREAFLATLAAIFILFSIQALRDLMEGGVKHEK